MLQSKHGMTFPPSDTSPQPEEQRPVDHAPQATPFSAAAYAGDESLGESWAPVLESRPAGQAWRRARHLSWELAQTLALAALIFLAVRAMAQNFRVEGSSMEPGLHHGQYLLVNKAIYFKIDLERLSRFIPFIEPGDSPERFLFRSPNRGDVVVFRFPQDPSRDFIKRMIAVPGDTIEINGGDVFVNGVQLEEPYISSEGRNSFERQVVPQGNYFVLGDNRRNSFDSRSWGFVPEQNIIGRAIFSYWPLEELGGVGNRSLNLGFVNIPLP